jgi:drug/metabolite transporter (DMT)-like permease
LIAVLGGLGAALAFSITTLVYARASRLLGPAVVTAWVMLVGLVVALPFALAGGFPDRLHGGVTAWLVLSGCGNVVGLVLTNAALRRGQVSVVGPIVSTEGAIAAVIAVLAGERLGTSSGAALAVIAVGIVAAGITRSESAAGASAKPAGLAILAACCFGASLYATARVGDVLPVIWAVLPARLIGAAALAAPLAASARLRLTRAAAPLVIAGGLAEVAGFASYTLGARHSVAVAAVIASQFGGISAVLAVLLFGERLRRVQIGGIVLIVAGVAALSALQN